MELKEIVDKAKYIQFPYLNREYRNRYEKRNPILLPIVEDRDVMYLGMPKGNGHHYTTWYTYNKVLPILSELFDFPYSLDDFDLVDTHMGRWDLSYLRPKKSCVYTTTCFSTGETITGDYLSLFNPIFFNSPLYRELYRFPHCCSKIVNNTIDSNKKLMISGDSQIIPAIAPLAYYFKEVWYFDNRTGWVIDPGTNKHIFNKDQFSTFSYTYKDVEFTDVLIECYGKHLHWCEYWNLQ